MKTNRLKYLTAVAILATTYVIPVYAENIPDAVTNEAAAIVTDTTDSYKNDPITNNFQLLGFEDAKANGILVELRKYSDAISSLSKTDEYLRLHENLQKAEKDLKDYRNDVLYDHLSDEERQAGRSFVAKWGGDDGRNEQLGDQIRSLGNKVGSYYGTKDFRKLSAHLQKKYGIDPDKKYSSDDKNYSRYQSELNSNIPIDIKKATEEMRVTSAKMNKMMNSPEYKADAVHLKKLIDSLVHFRSPDTEKKYQQAVSDAGEQFFAYTKAHEPERKRYSDSLKYYGEKLQAYYSTAEYKQHLKAWRDQMKTALGDDYEKIEHPDRPRDIMAKEGK